MHHIFVDFEMNPVAGEYEEERSFSGPLPPPEYLDAYEKTLPGAPDRILVMAEKQVDHRIDVEKTIVKKKFNQSTLGQIIGAILILFFGSNI